MKRPLIGTLLFLVIGFSIAFGSLKLTPLTPLTPSTKTAAMATKPPQQQVQMASISAVVSTPTPTPLPTIEPTPQPTTAPQTSYQGILDNSHTGWMRAAGIPESDWQYVDYIVSRESGWNPNAVNSSSGACGLGQQLPCGKWAGAWNDPVAALRAQHAYVVARYGSYAGAYAFWLANHWY